MTPQQLRTALARMGLSQRGAAIDERTMRKYVAGDLIIPEMLLRGLAQREQDEDANSGTSFDGRPIGRLSR